MFYEYKYIDIYVYVCTLLTCEQLKTYKKKLTAKIDKFSPACALTKLEFILVLCNSYWSKIKLLYNLSVQHVPHYSIPRTS